jgi:aspartokinase/homoserine dehydrogenase 1
MKIIKFGGAAISDRMTFEILLKFIQDSDEIQSVYVISAFSKTSSMLKQASLSALNHNYPNSENLIDRISDFHLNLIPQNKNEPIRNYNFIENFNISVKKILKGITITNELTPRISDRILAFGEDLAIETLKTGLNKPDIFYIDSRKIILTDNNYGKAKPIIESSRKNTLNIFSKFNNTIAITQGFVASAENGDTTTMGFESSNLTATLLADFLDAAELTIYTDVNGIYNIDPKKFQSAELICKINYATAIKASNYGLKLIYPEMINLAKEKHITIYYKNVLNLHSDNFTTISDFDKTDEFLIIITKINIPEIYYSQVENLIDEYLQINIINYSVKYFSHIIDIINIYNKSGLIKFIIQSPDAIQLILLKNDAENLCEQLLNIERF